MSTPTEQEAERTGLKALAYRYMPILDWLPAYDRAFLARDGLAALTVWALLVPEAMGYASLAGVPPEAGLYAAPLALLGYAVFGTSRHLFVGPSSTVAILSASTIAPLADEGSDEFIALTAALAIEVGVIFIVLGVVRLGWVSQFMSKPVLDAFIIGLAMIVALGQAPKLFGIEAEGVNFWQEAGDLISNLGDSNPETIVVGFGSLALLFAMARFTPRVPGALVAVILSILVVTFFDLEDQGVHIVGDIPAGLPPFGFPGVGFSSLVDMLPGSLGIVLVGYAESLAAAKQYARKHGYEVDPNQELIALGAANAGAGFSQGFVVDGSLSRTAAGEAAGQTSQMTSLMNLVFVLITIAALTPLFHNLAEATLGAIVIHAVWHLMDFNKLRRIYDVSKVEFWVALTCLLGVLTIDILAGLIIAVVASLLVLISRASTPSAPVLGRDPDENVYQSIERHPHSETFPGLVIFRFEAELFFANAAPFRERVRELVATADPPTKAILLDAEVIKHVDLTAAEMLRELVPELADDGIELLVARLRLPVRQMLRRTGLEDVIGTGRIFLTVREGVDDYLARHPEAGAGDRPAGGAT